MKTINEVKNDLVYLRRHLRDFKNLEHNFHYNSSDSEEQLLANKINAVLEKIEDIDSMVEKMDRKVIAEGRFQMNENGRYEIKGVELSSGSPVEYWSEAYGGWEEDRIEHFNGDYGLYYLDKNDIAGIRARVRERGW